MRANRATYPSLYASPYGDGGSIYGSPYATQGSAADPGLSQERQQALLDQSESGIGGLLSDIAWYLDTPGAMARGALSGTGALAALGQSHDERTNGRELLRQYGLASDQDNWANFTSGLAAEILLDPLAVLSGPVKALTPAGRVAARAGLLNRAPELLSRQFIAGGSDMAPELAERAAARLGKLGKTTVSQTEVAGRPLIGRRAAQRYGTLGDLLEYADDPLRARQSALDAVGGDEAMLERLAGQRLGGDVGVGLPLMDPSLSFRLPGGAGYSDAMDSLMTGIRWSAPGRLAHALSDKSVGGALDAESQALYSGAYQAAQRGAAEARREATMEAAKLYQAEPDVFTEEGNRVLGRLIEQPKVNPQAAADDVFSSTHPAARAYVDWWRDRANDLANEFTEAGLRGQRFADPNIEGYLPRRLDGVFRSAERQRDAGRILGTSTADQMSRTDELMVPGGRDTIAFDLSRDPFVAGGKRAAANDEEAATHIAQKLFGGAPTDEQLKQARGLAQILHRLPDDVASSMPLFGQHPTQVIGRYMEGRASASAMINASYDALATSTNLNPANLAEGGRHISLTEALQRIGARSTADDIGEVGAKEQMRRRLAERLGADADAIDLASLSVPEDVVNRLVRARETFERPEVAMEMIKAVGFIGRLWKSGILSWPARIIRDLYSGAFSNWVEGALDLRAIPVVRQIWDFASTTPFATGKDVARFSAFDPRVSEYLRTMPRYARMEAEDAAAAFYSDLASTGLLGSSVGADRIAMVRSGGIEDLLPGVAPETFVVGRNSAISELLSSNYNPLSGKFWDIDQNPISRAGAKASNLSDTINRLTGYMSLLRQGIDPMEAARRIKRAHVDYQSLTTAERWIRDNGVPFYAYLQRSLGEAMRQIAERPGGRYGQAIRAYESAQEAGEGDSAPEYMRKSFAAKIEPDDPLLGWLTDPTGENVTYLTGIDLPAFSTLSSFATGPTFFDAASETARNLSQNLTPFARIPYEFIAGVDSFTGQPINEAARGYGPVSKLVRAATGDPNAGAGRAMIALDKASDIVPYVARPLRAVASVFDPDRNVSLSTNAFTTAWNTAGLGRIRDVTPEQMRGDVIRRLQRLAAPYTRDVSIPSIPKGMEGRAPQDAVDALELSRELQEERRKLNRRRLDTRYQPR